MAPSSKLSSLSSPSAPARGLPAHYPATAAARPGPTHAPRPVHGRHRAGVVTSADVTDLTATTSIDRGTAYAAAHLHPETRTAPARARAPGRPSVEATACRHAEGRRATSVEAQDTVVVHTRAATLCVRAGPGQGPSPRAPVPARCHIRHILGPRGAGVARGRAATEGAQVGMISGTAGRGRHRHDSRTSAAMLFLLCTQCRAVSQVKYGKYGRLHPCLLLLAVISSIEGK